MNYGHRCRKRLPSAIHQSLLLFPLLYSSPLHSVCKEHTSKNIHLDMTDQTWEIQETASALKQGTFSVVYSSWKGRARWVRHLGREGAFLDRIPGMAGTTAAITTSATWMCRAEALAACFLPCLFVPRPVSLAFIILCWAGATKGKIFSPWQGATRDRGLRSDEHSFDCFIAYDLPKTQKLLLLCLPACIVS